MPAPDPNENLIVDTPNGGYSGTGFVQDTAPSFLRTTFDVYVSSVGENEYNTINGRTFITDGYYKYYPTTGIYPWYFDIYVGDTLVKRFNLRQDGSSGYYYAGSYVPLWIANSATHTSNLTYQLRYAGTYEVKLKILYAVSGSADSFTNTDECIIGSITVLPTVSNQLLLTGNYPKTFTVGDTFSYEGLVVTSNDVCQVSGISAGQNVVTSYSISSPDMSVAATHYITVSYGGQSAGYAIQVNNPTTYTVSSNLSTLLANMGSKYVGGQISISTSDLVVTITPSQGAPFTTNYYTIKFNGNSFTNPITLTQAGTNTFSIDCEYGSTFTSFTVMAVTLSSISVSTSVSFKTNYYTGQTLDLSGLTITRTYNNGSTNTTLTVTSNGVVLLDSSNNVVEKDKTIVIGDNNCQLKLQYSENGTTVTSSVFATLSVTQKAVSSISVYQNPTKMAFAINDLFTLSGLIIKVYYNSGDEDVIQYDNANLTYETSPSITLTSSHKVATSNTTGNLSITFTYSSKTVVLNGCSIIAPTISSVTTNALSGLVTTDYKEGDTFSFSGLVVSVEYTNGYTENISITQASDVDATSLGIADLTQSTTIPTNGNSGTKTIDISTEDSFGQTVTASYQVALSKSGAIVGAVLVWDSSSLDYYVGDYFTAKNLYWRTVNVYGEQVDVSVTATNTLAQPALNTQFRAAERVDVNLRYTNGSFVSDIAKITLNINIKDVVSTEVVDCKIAFGSSDGVLFINKNGGGIYISFSNSHLSYHGTSVRLGKYDTKKTEIYPIFKQNVSVDNVASHVDTYGKNVYTGSDYDNDCIGYIDLGWTDDFGNVIRKSHVVMFKDVVNPIEGSLNIEVTFPHYVPDYSDRINNARFGIIYNNRLFVSGNPNYKNCDWHSGEVTGSKGNALYNYSYFSDLDYCYYGTDETAVVGYDIFRDGELLAIKEGSRNQATIYRRSYKLTNAISYDGSSASEDGSLVEEIFPMFDVNANGGIGGLSHRSIINFVGDTLVATRDGIKIITDNDNVNNNAKYSKDVSTYINPKIVKESINGAIMFSFDQKLLLRTSRGLYVGYYELRNEQGEYEWFFLEGIEADLFFEYDHELYFANKKGAICRFPEDGYKYNDIVRSNVGAGGVGLILDEDEDTLVASSTYADEIVTGRDFHLVYLNKPIHANLGEFINQNTRANYIENSVTFDPTDYVGLIDDENSIVEIKCYTDNTTENLTKTIDVAPLFYSGREVFFDKLDGNNIAVATDTKYYLEKVPDEPLRNRFYVIDRFGEKVNLQGIDTCRLSFRVDERVTTKIGDVTDHEGGKMFELIGDHDKKLDFIYYKGDDTVLYSGIVTKTKAVIPFYATIPYSFGSLSQTKTIWSVIIANDTALGSHIDMGFLTSSKQGTYNVVNEYTSGSIAETFNKYSYATIQFTSDKLPHVYVMNRVFPALNYARFLFTNDNDSNIVLSRFEITYSLSQFTKGVK